MRNFSDNEVFSNNKHNINRYDRSRNLLYVCCSRPKKRPALYSITRAPTLRRQQAFGSDRTICINNVNNIYAFIPRNKSSRLPTEWLHSCWNRWFFVLNVSDESGSLNYVVRYDWSRIMMSDGSLSRSENGNFLAYRYKLVWHRIDGVFRELR